MRGIADGHDVPIPATIEDPAVLEELRAILRPPPVGPVAAD
jgi:propionyl-CoA synthetase